MEVVFILFVTILLWYCIVTQWVGVSLSSRFFASLSTLTALQTALGRNGIACGFVKTISKLSSYRLKGTFLSLPCVLLRIVGEVYQNHFLMQLILNINFAVGALSVAILQYKKQLGITEQKQTGKLTFLLQLQSTLISLLMFAAFAITKKYRQI